MSVGDISSDKRGTAARYNDGKPDFSLIPLSIYGACIGDSPLGNAVMLVGEYQMRKAGVESLFEAISELEKGYDGLWENTARVFEYGKQKYAAWNWRKGFNWSVPLACIGRHTRKMVSGEALDDESGLPHEAHIMCNIIMLIEFYETYPEGDDRPPLVKGE